MSRKVLIQSFALLGIGGALMLAPRQARAWDGFGWFGCKCPPPLIHCPPGPPKIKFKCACPKPICNPCEMEGWGYYQTCWRQWPYPPSCAHCQPQAPPLPLPGAGVPVIVPKVTTDMDPLLPAPRSVEGASPVGQ